MSKLYFHSHLCVNLFHFFCTPENLNKIYRVREITNSLISLYGIKGKVWGIRGGYKGFYDTDTPPIDLNPKVVENIHHEGGTVLSSSRGGFDLDKIIAFIEKKKIKQLYVIGGDGTHRGAFIIHEGCMKKVCRYWTSFLPNQSSLFTSQNNVNTAYY